MGRHAIELVFNRRGACARGHPSMGNHGLGPFENVRTCHAIDLGYFFQTVAIGRRRALVGERLDMGVELIHFRDDALYMEGLVAGHPFALFSVYSHCYLWMQ